MNSPRTLCVFGRDSYGDADRGETHEHANFLPALRNNGHDVLLFDSFVRRENDDFAGLNVRFLRTVEEYRPDFIFLVLMNYEIWTETLDLVRAHTPAITINWGTDDSWKFEQVSRFLAPHLDFHVTTDKSSMLRAQRLKLDNVLESQWATSGARLATPLPSASCEYDVSFVGQLYGNRKAWIDGLRARGINVVTFGHGSERGAISAESVTQVYRTSRISLNFADSGRQLSGMRFERSAQIKARVFEVTGGGGFLLTENVDALKDYFAIGTEIDVFQNPDELAEKIRHYIKHSDERNRMASKGHLRTAQEHTYSRRFAELFNKASSRALPQRAQRPWTLSADMLRSHVESHRNTRMIKPIRPMLERPAQAIFGRQRGSRAARRFLFEASIRICGERTFSAAGLPGRLFYLES